MVTSSIGRPLLGDGCSKRVKVASKRADSSRAPEGVCQCVTPTDSCIPLNYTRWDKISLEDWVYNVKVKLGCEWSKLRSTKRWVKLANENGLSEKDAIEMELAFRIANRKDHDRRYRMAEECIEEHQRYVRTGDEVVSQARSGHFE